MSTTCPKCSKVMSSKRRLRDHLEKNVPCDFVCRVCCKKCETRDGYKWHRKKVHEEKKKEEDDIEEIEPFPVQCSPVNNRLKIPMRRNLFGTQPSETALMPARRAPRVRLPRGFGGRSSSNDSDLIPIQDYNHNYLAYMNELANVNADDTVDEVEVEFCFRVKYKLRSCDVIRARRAADAFQTADYARTLRCLEHDVKMVAANVLTGLHSDPGRPELHTIRLGDFARKNVSMYSRPSIDDDACHWLSFGKVSALNTLSNHMAAVLTFALERACQMLEPGFCEDERVVCFCFRDDAKNTNLIIIDDDPDGLKALCGGGQVGLQVKYYSGLIIACPEELHDQAIELANLINQRTDEVVAQLRNLVFSERDLMEFLESTRRPFTMLPPRIETLV